MKLNTGKLAIWSTAAALAITLLLLIGIVGLVAFKGFAAFWPEDLIEYHFNDGSKVMGKPRLYDEEENRLQLKIGNRDIYGLDFKWLSLDGLKTKSNPNKAVILERESYGQFYGFLPPQVSRDQFEENHQRIWLVKKRMTKMEHILAEISREMEGIKKEKKHVSMGSSELQELQAKLGYLNQSYEALLKKVDDIRSSLEDQTLDFSDISGQNITIGYHEIIRLFSTKLDGCFCQIRIIFPKDLGIAD